MRARRSDSVPERDMPRARTCMGFVRGRAGGGAIGYSHSSRIGMVPISVSFFKELVFVEGARLRWKCGFLRNLMTSSWQFFSAYSWMYTRGQYSCIFLPIQLIGGYEKPSRIIDFSPLSSPCHNRLYPATRRRIQTPDFQEPPNL